MFVASVVPVGQVDATRASLLPTLCANFSPSATHYLHRNFFILTIIPQCPTSEREHARKSGFTNRTENFTLLNILIPAWGYPTVLFGHVETSNDVQFVIFQVNESIALSIARDIAHTRLIPSASISIPPCGAIVTRIAIC